MADDRKNQQKEDPLFSELSCVTSERILYTPSSFAKTNLLHLQETGTLTALSPHKSQREKLLSCLCFIVLEGKGQLSYGERIYPLSQGDIVFIDCWKPYSHSTGGKKEELWALQWCHFYGPSLPAIYAKYCERGGGPVIHPSDIKPYTDVLDELYRLASSEDYIRDMRINENLSALLTCLMSESWHPGRRRGYREKQDVQQVKEYLDGHFQEKLSLESAAEQFFINKHYLARLFKEQYGVTFTAYLQQVRITHAKQLLRFTDKKIEEIGLECGCGDLTYFSRMFKKIEGVSPREYRSLW